MFPPGAEPVQFQLDAADHCTLPKVNQCKHSKEKIYIWIWDGKRCVRRNVAGCKAFKSWAPGFYFETASDCHMECSRL